jgi:outer dense fiber protein 2
MEIQPARDNQHSDANAARRHDEPDTDEEDRQSCRVRQYEKRIETLMEQVAVLKEDVERANKAPDVGSPAGQLPLHDRLMKQLAEVDACVESVSKHLCTVSSALQQRQKDEKRVGDTVATATVLANHRQLLLDKMAALDTSCRRLKQTLSEQREQTSSQQCLIEQRDQLISQITRLELAAKASKKELKEKTVQIAELRALCDLQTDEALGATELQGSLETSKSQLMKQLRQRDLDCSKMALELQNVHNQLSHERGEVENLRLLVREAQLKAKLLRKKSSRQLGSSGCPDEDDAGRPTNMDRDSVVGSLQTELDSLRDYCNKLVQERTQHSDEAAAFQTRVRELETVIERMAEDGKKELAVITSRLHDKSAEAADYCRENERLRSSLSSMECKLDHVTCDATVLRAKVAEYERMIEDYRCQLTRSRREADDTLSRLEDTRRDMNRLRQENENELDRVKQQMQARLK